MSDPIGLQGSLSGPEVDENRLALHLFLERRCCWVVEHLRLDGQQPVGTRDDHVLGVSPWLGSGQAALSSSVNTDSANPYSVKKVIVVPGVELADDPDRPHPDRTGRGADGDGRTHRWPRSSVARFRCSRALLAVQREPSIGGGGKSAVRPRRSL